MPILACGEGKIFDVEYIYGFVGWGSASKVDDVTALPSHMQDGGYALLWQRYDNKMAAICYYGNVMATTRWRLCVTILHLQQYSRRLNLFFFLPEIESDH